MLQGALGSRVTGRWDVSLVRHIDAKQQALGLTPHGGILFDATFAAIGTEMISRGGEDAVLQMIVDYYKLDRSGVLNIVFDPIAPPPPHDKANAQTTSVGGSGTPGVVRVFPRGFAQPFAGLVHTVAHELGHIEQVIQGIASENVREFLSNGIEIESKNLPEESIESDADIDLINRSLPPTQGGLIDDTFSMLRWWSLMTPSEKQAHHQRYRELRDIIFRRIVTQATSSQKSKLAGLIIQLADADQGVP